MFYNTYLLYYKQPTQPIPSVVRHVMLDTFHTLCFCIYKLIHCDMVNFGQIFITVFDAEALLIF